jgi:hypothetical protein
LAPNPQLETEALPAPIEPNFDLDEVGSWDEPPEQPRHAPGIKVEDLRTVLQRVDSAPDPAYLIRGLMAEGDHGMLAAEFKAGKTWAVTDLAVSVASGTPWLGRFEIDSRGPVLLFAGEGGERKIARRFRAICESRDLDAEVMPIRVCTRVPHLSDDAAMVLVEDEIEQHRPVLVIIDPLYLAARGAKSSDLFAMGEVLEAAQSVCQRYGAALLITHHWNKTGEGKGAKRNSGAGTDAWGRLLISISKISIIEDPATGGTVAVLEFEFQGDEIAESSVLIRRRVWADDRDSLTSPMHYEVEPFESSSIISDPRLSGLTPAAARVLEILETDGAVLTVRDIGDRMAQLQDGRSVLKPRTIQDALARLSKTDKVSEVDATVGGAGHWKASRAHLVDVGAGNVV